MTSKVDPRTERVKYLYCTPYNICIQMKRKELSKTFMKISNGKKHSYQIFFSVLRVKPYVHVLLWVTAIYGCDFYTGWLMLTQLYISNATSM